MNPKDEFAISECKDVRARRMLEFLVPILYTEKLIQVTIIVENTIFRALSEEQRIDWFLVIRDVVVELLFDVGKRKPIPICSFVFHLYEYLDTMRGTKRRHTKWIN